MKKLLSAYSSELKAVEQKQHQVSVGELTDTVMVTAKPTATAKAQQHTQDAHQRRIKQQQKVKKLHEQQ